MVDWSAFEQNAPRKFIDLIWRKRKRFPVWDPSTESVRVSSKLRHPSKLKFSLRKVGDYGQIDKNTGSFRCEGNIYNSKDESLVKWAKEHRPVVTGEYFNDATSQSPQLINLDETLSRGGGAMVKLSVRTTAPAPSRA